MNGWWVNDRGSFGPPANDQHAAPLTRLAETGIAIPT
jgi:hypothetical protein